MALNQKFARKARIKRRGNFTTLMCEKAINLTFILSNRLINGS